MEISQHIAALQRDGDLLAVAAQQAGLRAAVPPCPGWQVRDLLRHLSYVHRWAAGFIAERRTEPLRDRPPEAEILAGGPPDAGLIDWFRAGHAALVQTLRTADPALACWTVLPGPSAVASWARRQAHETAIHRADAELAAGQVTPLAADFAADGIDELIMGFCGRDAAALTAEQQGGPRRMLRVLAADAGTGPAGWLVELTADGTLAARVSRVSRGAGPADCTLAGSAAALYLLLWNRADLAGSAAGVTVSGDAAVVRLWRDGVRVAWGGSR
jgi:uncharacterized protein (TIGR03083 family)